MQAEAQDYFYSLLKKHGMTPEKAKKLTKAVYPTCDVNKLKENPYGKVVLKDNPRKPTKKQQEALSEKISLLIDEGYPKDQAVAIAYSMVLPQFKANPKPNADTYSRLIQMLIRFIGPELDHRDYDEIQTHVFSFKPMHVLMAVSMFMSRESSLRSYLARMRMKVTHLKFNDVDKTMEITFEKLGTKAKPVQSFIIELPGNNKSIYTMELPLNGKN